MTDQAEAAAREIARATPRQMAEQVVAGFSLGNSNRSGTVPSGDWRNYPGVLPDIIERLRGVTIENRDAIECMTLHDGPTTLHYVDPPYLPETRSLKNPYDLKYRGGMYAHELDSADHSRLIEALRALDGMVLLSGYGSRLYDDALADWQRIEIDAFADGARPRIEVLWINSAASAALHRHKAPLFALSDQPGGAG